MFSVASLASLVSWLPCGFLGSNTGGEEWHQTPAKAIYPNLIENCRCNVEPNEFIQTPAKTMIRNPSLIEKCTYNFETYEFIRSNLGVGAVGN